MATKKELELALKNLVEKIHYVSNNQEFLGQFTMSFIHGNPYNGPTWEKK